MQKILKVLCGAFVFISLHNFANAATVLIYKGAGACTDGCAVAAAEIPASMGHTIKYVTTREVTEELFEGAIMWIQPGGNSIKAAQSLGPEKLRLIRNFVGRGGAYVGFCAGAFLADKTVDDDGEVPGLGIIPFTTDYYPIDSKYPWGILIESVWNAAKRTVYFNGGATFDLTRSKHPVQVLAQFAADGAPLTIQTTYKKGNVVVTGAHPEATEAWKRQGGLSDTDGPDYDLAKDMVQRALAK